MRLESVSSVDVKFLAPPVGGTTIPQLELLSALLLSKLITSIQTALKAEVHLSNPVCFTDSKAALYWIQGVKHEWKQFVMNRIVMIQNLIEPQNW